MYCVLVCGTGGTIQASFRFLNDDTASHWAGRVRARNFDLVELCPVLCASVL